MTCLGERHRALATAIGMFERVDADLLAHADRLVSDLPSLAVCGDEVYLRAKVRPPADPQVAARVDALRKDLQSAGTLETGGQFDEALAVIDPAIAAAPPDYAPLRAELAYAKGTILENLGRYEEARAAFESAFFFAVESGHHDFTIDAANRLAYVVGRRLADRKASKEWLEHASIYALRDGDPLRRGRVATTRGALANLAMTMGGASEEEARKAFEVAGRAFTEARAEDSVDYARYLRFHGDYLSITGEHDAAILTHAASLDLMAKKLGAQHPDVAMVHNSHGISLMRPKHYERSLAALDAGLAAAVDLPNQRNHVYMTLYSNRSDVLSELDRLPEAEQSMRAAIAVLERSSSKGLSETCILRRMLARLVAEQGRPADAEALLRDDLARAEQAWGPHDPRLMDILTQLADERRQAGDPHEARSLAERALALAIAAPDEMPGFQYYIRVVLARILADLGEVPRAIELVREARAHTASKPSMEGSSKIAAIDRLLVKLLSTRGGK